MTEVNNTQVSNKHPEIAIDMRLSPLFVSLFIAAPGALALIVQMKAEDSSLTIFGVDGPRDHLDFQGKKAEDYLLISPDKDPLGNKLKAGNASFRHTTGEKHVDVRPLW